MWYVYSMRIQKNEILRKYQTKGCFLVPQHCFMIKSSQEENICSDARSIFVHRIECLILVKNNTCLIFWRNKIRSKRNVQKKHHYRTELQRWIDFLPRTHLNLSKIEVEKHQNRKWFFDQPWYIPIDQYLQ